MDLLSITNELREAVRPLTFGPPVTHVYNPIEYAMAPMERYFKKYGRGKREILLLGMNPGPFGMAQTGIPFGDVEMVRAWLHIEAPVGKPDVEHPKRKVAGFNCPRGEVSGARLWGWARERFGTPQRFFKRFFVANYCPLCFIEDSGRNRTPDKLPAVEHAPLFAACDRALRATVEYFQPRHVVGIGKFAEARARVALDGLGVPVGTILHPSPASPLANRGWAPAAEAALEKIGIHLS
jgi:single-strand selective monofunctional uracil DNA glycosylase